VQRELRAIAAAQLRQERSGHTLQPTALVNEAYLRLHEQSRSIFRNREHFLAIASTAMRRVLVDHARAKRTHKRDTASLQFSLDELSAAASERIDDVLQVDSALSKLAEVDPVAAQVVEMRFFAGMTELEIAKALERSDRWVRMQWAFARAWLRRHLDSEN
jgi:RNA polymerase sigma factor (TIGR02999 family)